MTTLEPEWATICNDLSEMEKIHDQYLSKLAELTKLQESCLKAVKHHNYIVGNFRETLAKAEIGATNEEAKTRIQNIKNEMSDARIKLKEMEAELPVQDNGFYLSLILGKNLNLSLMSKHDRYRYKQDYESFKWRVTIAVLVATFLSYIFPWRVMDSIGNFLMVWYYGTLTIREGILTINGSKIKGWWVIHHYISCGLSGIVLIWKEGECYRTFRPQFLLFVGYIGIVQLLQNQYQSGCLRRLHSLGQGHQMDITVEGFTSWMFKGLTFLLPFLVAGYFFQLYNAYTLWHLSFECTGQWQVPTLSALFLILAVGNIYTTSLVIFKKFRSSGSYQHIININRKYRSRNKKEE